MIIWKVKGGVLNLMKDIENVSASKNYVQSL